jgi:hypothetical protein
VSGGLNVLGRHLLKRALRKLNFADHFNVDDEAEFKAIPAEALFLEYREASGEILTPELFPRADRATWVCAISSMGPLPVDPADVAADEGAHARLEALCRTISPALAAAPIKARQACFRPVTEDGLPLIGAVPDVDGAYVATGHSVWGMLNAPATGEAMSELILDGGARHVDLAPFAPGRLRRSIRRICAAPHCPHRDTREGRRASWACGATTFQGSPTSAQPREKVPLRPPRVINPTAGLAAHRGSAMPTISMVNRPWRRRALPLGADRAPRRQRFDQGDP